MGGFSQYPIAFFRAIEGSAALESQLGRSYSGQHKIYLVVNGQICITQLAHSLKERGTPIFPSLAEGRCSFFMATKGKTIRYVYAWQYSSKEVLAAYRGS